MLEFYQSLPGQFKIIFYVVTGMVIGLPLLAIPQKTLIKIGKTPYLSPNWLTLWRMPISWLGYMLYFLGYYYLGFSITVFAFILDRFDGKVAAANDLGNKKDPNHQAPTGKFWEDLNYSGSTPTGKWLDPFGDKISVPIPMIIFSITGFLQWYLVVAMLAFEVVGTLIRKPFLPLKPFNRLTPYIRAEGASWAGKIKVVAQYVAIFLGMTIHQKWVEVDSRITFSTLAIVNLMAVISIATRLKTNTQFDKANEEASSAFDHKE